MASPATSSAVLVVVLVATLAAGGANAATFTITNRCSFTVWPAATPVGGGVQLNPGADVDHQRARRDQLRQGFDGSGRGSCATGDCAGALSCTLSGQKPLTLAEFTIGGSQDFYDLSVIDGYNVAMSFSCSSGVTVTCRDSRCPDAYLFPEDNTKTHACSGNSNYQVVFCP
ncbi:hypothetical protein OsJ_36953 [Oryza sativa Japonica Group]|uniref:Thaumatin-like protein n=1 Tax=Oryza sativa subsp. japonica TaxID=39947 RepID=B9GEE5_ORYSJ|nr:hypothetical protein OsJ_36953 [Oryza sativa Japonica Group]